MALKKADLAQRMVYQAIRERAGGRCECCGGPPDWRGLQVHHLIPKGMGGSRRVYNKAELRLLCGRCHAEAHGIRERSSII